MKKYQVHFRTMVEFTDCSTVAANSPEEAIELAREKLGTLYTDYIVEPEDYEYAFMIELG